MFSFFFALGVILLIATGVLALALAGRASSPGAVRTAGILLILIGLIQAAHTLLFSLPAVHTSFSDPQALLVSSALLVELSYGLLMAGALVALMIAVTSRSARTPRPGHAPAPGPPSGHAHGQPPAFGHPFHAPHGHDRPHPAEHAPPPPGPAVHGGGPAAHGGGHGHDRYPADTGSGDGDGGGGGD